jgi:nucleoside-diphosphate-sugar epimerase
LRILISGASGYIGSYLINYLNEMGYDVEGITRDKNSLSQKLDTITFHELDILDISSLQLNQKYDCFIHLAAANDIDSKDDEKALKNTTLSTKKALDFCIENQINKFIYFSTFQVYGTNEGKVDENSSVNCLNNYALTHFFAEEYVRQYLKKGIEYIIFRPTNVYGLSLCDMSKRDTLVPTCFCYSLVQNNRIELLSSGKQYRNFISLEELSRSVKSVLEEFNDSKNAVYNLASDLNLTIYDVALMVKDIYDKISKKKSSIDILSSEPSDSKILDISLKKLVKQKSSKENFNNEVKKLFVRLKKNESS